MWKNFFILACRIRFLIFSPINSGTPCIYFFSYCDTEREVKVFYKIFCTTLNFIPFVPLYNGKNNSAIFSGVLEISNILLSQQRVPNGHWLLLFFIAHNDTLTLRNSTEQARARSRRHGLKKHSVDPAVKFISLEQLLHFTRIKPQPSAFYAVYKLNADILNCTDGKSIAMMPANWPFISNFI